MPKITFLPAGVTVEVPDGTSVFAAAAKAEIPIPSQCGGKCACALCRVKLVEGGELVSPIQWDEEGHMGNVFYLTQERLSCQTRVYGDVVVEVEDTPVKEKVRGRYIPYSLIRKREQLEQQEELLRVRKGDRGGDRPSRSGGGGHKRPAGEGPAPHQPKPDRPKPEQRPTPDPTPEPAEGTDAPPTAPADGPKKRRRRRRRRNPGAPRPGDSKPPAGKED